jgi:hypothetical protein
VSDLLLITSALEPSAEVLPALGLLLHPVRVLPADASPWWRRHPPMPCW